MFLFSLRRFLRQLRLTQRLGSFLAYLGGRVVGSSHLQTNVGGVIYARAVGLPSPTSRFSVRGVDTCTVADGAVLRGSLLLPVGQPGPFPTVIIRTPYGRKEDFGQNWLAERGFAVLVQDTRGRFSSDGDFVPVKDEREDGAATLAWVKQQPWCNGRVGVTGVSYLGFTAWATIGAAGEEVDAAVIIISQARVKPAIMHRDGAFSFELGMLWLYLVLNLMVDAEQDPISFPKKAIAGWWNGTLEKATMHLPLCETDSIILGKPVPFWQEGIRSYDDPESKFWEGMNDLNDFSGVTPPTHMLTGWYDFFLEQCLEDFNNAGSKARITIGPFSHWGTIPWDGLFSKILIETFQEHLCDQPPQTRDAARMRAAVLGASAFMSFAEWPPPSSPRVFFLDAEGRLSLHSQEQWHQTYKYDPAKPTPAAGGASFNFLNAGAMDQSQIEAREDVLVFTSPPLESDLLVAGKVKLEIVVEVGSESADFVGRVCDVSPDGVSLNRCEGLTRVWKRGSQRVVVDLGSTCCLFRRGHSLRLHVCSGAHPRWFRNLQTGDPIATATQMVSASHKVCAGSILTLPMLAPESRL